MSKKLLLSIITLFTLSFSLNAQIVNIPDVNLKNKLLLNTQINTNGDTEIQLSEATSFTGTFICSSSFISDLTGIEAFTAMTQLHCQSNNIAIMDLSANVSLVRLYANNNGLITSLDLSNNPNLTHVVCHTTSLAYLNVANGNNNGLFLVDATNNNNLGCVQHDSGFNPFSNNNWTKSNNTNWSSNCPPPPPCIVNIPDANFKASLVNNTAINTNGNTEIECTEASAYTGAISYTSSSSSDLTGIEAFVNITSLSCWSSQLSILDVSANTALTYLQCNSNQLTSLDVSNNTALTTLICGNNGGLSNLDVSNNTALTVLFCDNSQISNIDVSNNTLLEELYVNFTQISAIDLSNNTMLDQLWCGNSNLTSLDLSSNTVLTRLYADNNQLSSINLLNNNSLLLALLNNNVLANLDISGNPNLVGLDLNNNLLSSVDFTNQQFLSELYIDDNTLSSLDLSSVSTLDNLSCNNNDLTSLNIKNGNNINMGLFTALNNPNLTCIEVDDTTYSNTNFTNIDAIANFSLDCGGVLVSSINVDGQNGVSTITINGGTLQMEAELLPLNADYLTYTWSVTNGTGSATISTTGLLTATADGTVEVTATANDASGTVGTKTIIISNQSVGINDLGFENVSFYPNPTNGIINLNISETISSIRLIDLTGKTIQVFNADAKQLDIKEFSQGIYFLEIANAEKKSVVKIIKK